MIEVSNGRLRGTTHNADGTTTYEWFVATHQQVRRRRSTPARYAHFADTIEGERGKLTLDFWPLAIPRRHGQGQCGR